MQEFIAKPSLLIYVVIYIILMVLIGAYYTKKAKTSDEFVRAGGGWDNVVNTNLAMNPDSMKMMGGQTLAGFLAGYLPLFFLSLGDQNLYQRIGAGAGDKNVRTGFVGWFIGLVVMVPLVAVIAFCAKAVFGENITAGMAFMSTTTLIPTVAGGLLLAASAAFIITTGDSYLLSGATNITYDIYVDRFKPEATDRQKFVFTRATIVIIGILAYIILQFFPTILAIQYWSYTVYGAGITPAVIGALCWKKVTKAGGVASMVVGSLLTIIYEAMGQPLGIATVIIAVPVATIVLIVVSLMTQSSNKEA